MTLAPCEGAAPAGGGVESKNMSLPPGSQVDPGALRGLSAPAGGGAAEDDVAAARVTG